MEAKKKTLKMVFLGISFFLIKGDFLVQLLLHALFSQVCRALTFFNEGAAEGVCHLDVVELNPYLASVEEAAVTVCTSQQVLTTWLRTQRVLGAWGAPTRRGDKVGRVSLLCIGRKKPTFFGDIKTYVVGTKFPGHFFF